MIKYLGVENEYTVFKKDASSGRIVTAKEVLDWQYLSRMDCSMRKKLFLFATDTDGFCVTPLSFQVWLTNGGKVYRDRNALEYASPECASICDAALAEKAGDEIVRIVCECLGEKSGVYLMKRSASKFVYDSRTWGSHENYAIPGRSYAEIIDELQSSLRHAVYKLYIAGRQLFSGSGHLGYLGPESKKLAFWISPRMQFMAEHVNSGTTGNNRAIINIRTTNESHMEGGNLEGFKRFHVITGDMNRADWSVYLRLGVTALILEFLQFARGDLLGRLANSFADSGHLLNIAKGASLSFSEPSFRKYFEQLLAMQYMLRDSVFAYKTEISEKLSEFDRIFELWSGSLDAAAGKPEQAEIFSRRLDFLIKKRWIEEYIGGPISDLGKIDDESIAKKLLALDFSYSRINHGDFYKALVENGSAEEMYQGEEGRQFCFVPPAGRAALRTEIAKEIIEGGMLKKLSVFDWGRAYFVRRKSGSGDAAKQKVLIFDDSDLAVLQSKLANIKKWLEEG